MPDTCPLYCRYCGARLRRDAVGHYCPTRNCQWQYGVKGCRWADLLMAWYEGHTLPSPALRDEIVRALKAYARQQVAAWKEQGT